MNDATRKLLNLPLTIDAYYPPQEGEAHALDNEQNSSPVHHEPEQPPEIADIIREETNDGRTVVKFLVSAMQDELVDFRACHRLDAARQLIKFGFDPAQSFLDAYMSIQGPAPARAATAAPAEPTHELHPDLARIIAEEAQDGRTAVRFLVRVMLGELPDFKPHHRINCAKELLRLGFPTKVAQEPEQAPEPELKPGCYFTLSDGRTITYGDNEHDPTCDCNSGLTDCFGSPSKHIDLEPRGIKGKAERAAFDAAFPDYVPPTDREQRRVVGEYFHNKNPEAPLLRDIPLPFVKDEAQKLFEQDRRERAEGRVFPFWWDSG